MFGMMKLKKEEFEAKFDVCHSIHSVIRYAPNDVDTDEKK
jgi:hypothetical protein